MLNDLANDFMKVFGSVVALGGSIYGYSEKTKNFYSSGFKCPNCNKTLITKSFLGAGSPKYYSEDGTEIKNGSLKLFNRDTMLECPSCGYRWNLYGKSNPTRPNKLEFMRIESTHRLKEDFGIDNELIDNSKSAVKITRKLTFTKEWSKRYSITYENAQINGMEFNLGIKIKEIDFGSIKRTSEETLKKEYSVSEERRETYIDEITLDIAEYQKVNVILSWKHIWQHGFMKFRYQDNAELDIPFRVIVGVTYDISTQ